MRRRSLEDATRSDNRLSKAGTDTPASGNQVRGVTILNANIVLGACLWSGAAFASALLLPSQETTNFYNAKMCRDAGVLSALKAAAEDILKTRVMIAGAGGSKWSGYQPDDVRLEAVSILSKNEPPSFVA